MCPVWHNVGSLFVKRVKLSVAGIFHNLATRHRTGVHIWICIGCLYIWLCYNILQIPLLWFHWKVEHFRTVLCHYDFIEKSSNLYLQTQILPWLYKYNVALLFVWMLTVYCIYFLCWLILSVIIHILGTYIIRILPALPQHTATWYSYYDLSGKRCCFKAEKSCWSYFLDIFIIITIHYSLLILKLCLYLSTFNL